MVRKASSDFTTGCVSSYASTCPSGYCKMANFSHDDILATLAKGVFLLKFCFLPIETLHVQYSTSHISFFLFLKSETRIAKIFHHELGQIQKTLKILPAQKISRSTVSL